jgi:TPR repeat protein
MALNDRRNWEKSMFRWIVIAALLLAMGAEMPARAADLEDCKRAGKLARTAAANVADVMEACRRLANNGLAFAQFNLGLLIYFHPMAKRDRMEEARWWFRLAAEQGFAPAQTALANLYRYVAADDLSIPEWGLMAHWYRKAADQGQGEGQFYLGLMYADGRGGLAQDYVQAYMWIILSSARVPENDYDVMEIDRFIATGMLDLVAAKMTPAQIVQAKALAAAWKPKAAN